MRAGIRRHRLRSSTRNPASMSQDVAFQYRFGRFVVEPRERRLLADGEPVTAGPRAFDVLLALIERAGQLVTKDELLARVWPKLVVEENNLQVQVSALRKIVGQQAIATIPGQGYRFTLEIERTNEGPSSFASLRNNLPQQLTSFIGHDDDLDEYAALLEQTRLFTLTGIGGSGKSRLAIKLAERVLPSFADGVWYVDLAPLLDAERVSLTVATALGIREESGRPIVDMLCKHLSRQRTLLILDNCEHLAAACAALARQQTLLATIQWSYDHLATEEQQLLRRISVFAGGWTLEAAARVADGQRDEYAVLDPLAQLVDQSLVTTHRVDADTTRYSMLE